MDMSPEEPSPDCHHLSSWAAVGPVIMTVQANVEAGKPDGVEFDSRKFTKSFGRDVAGTAMRATDDRRFQ